MDKFRAGAADDARALRATCLGVGDRARRAHRHGTLDGALAGALHAEATATRAALERWLAGVRSSAAYTGAVRALADGDVATLRGALPLLFDGVAAVPSPTALFH